MGKTALASEICNMALDSDYKVIYMKQDEYIDIVKGKVISNIETAKYRKLKSADIICIDDFLYLDVNDDELDILYKTLMYFNETTSLILITNRKIDKITEVFTNKHIINTFIDRLKSNSHIVVL